MTPETVFKCLGDETRLMATLLIFDQCELCVCELMDALGESQPKISRHLAQLRACEVLSDQRRGQWVFYSLSQSAPDWLEGILLSASEAKREQLAESVKKLKAAERQVAC